MEHTHGTWGNRIVTRNDDYSLTAILYLKPYKRCSWHFHKHIYNQFFVISGEITIKTDIGPNNQENYTTISEGQSFTIPPGVTHEFRTEKLPAIVEEIAYVKYEIKDIYRKQLGGDIDKNGS